MRLISFLIVLVVLGIVVALLYPNIPALIGVMVLIVLMALVGGGRHRW